MLQTVRAIVTTICAIFVCILRDATNVLVSLVGTAIRPRLEKITVCLLYTSPSPRD